MPKSKAQELCEEIYRAVEMPLGDAWVSDEAGTDDPAEYLRFVRGHLAAVEEARTIIKKFLRKHRALSS